MNKTNISDNLQAHHPRLEQCPVLKLRQNSTLSWVKTKNKQTNKKGKKMRETNKQTNKRKQRTEQRMTEEREERGKKKKKKQKLQINKMVAMQMRVFLISIIKKRKRK